MSKQLTPLTIVKVGGRVVDEPTDRRLFLQTFSELKGAKILVHGGGSQASALCEKLGIPIRKHEGRRITDTATMEVAVMVYAGLINKTLVAELQSLGVDALGLSGADRNCILAEKRAVTSIDYGWVGDIRQVNSTAIATLLQQGVSPVFCAITHDGAGQLLNTNADTIAAQLAMALSERFQVRLCFCLDKEGVLDAEEKLISGLDSSTYQRLKSQLVIRDGMIPKLDNAFSVVNKSKAHTFVCGLNNFVNGGTQILP